LDGEVELGNLSFSELKAKLEFRFSEGHLARAYYSQIAGRKGGFRDTRSGVRTLIAISLP